MKPWALLLLSGVVCLCAAKPQGKVFDLINAAADCPIIPLPVPLPDPSNPGSVIQKGIADALAAVQATLDKTKIPGGSFAVAYRGEILNATGLGVADKDKNTPVDPSRTLFRVASVSKIIPTLMARRLVANETIRSLDDPISKSVNDFGVMNPYGEGKVTWRHLMEQRSGLQREAPVAETTNEVLSLLQKTMLVNAPGSRPSYSNLGFSLLGNLIAERLLDYPENDFATCADNLVFHPLNMTNSGFTYTSSVLSRLATGYLPTGDPAPFTNFTWSAPCGGAYSTPSDLVQMMSSLMLTADSGSFPASSPPVHSATVDPLQLGSVNARQLLDIDYWNPGGTTLFGAPWEADTDGAYLVLRKGGNIQGYTSLVAAVPDLQLAVAVTWNGGTDEFTNGDTILHPLITAFTNALQPLQPSPAAPPGPKYQDLVGLYLNEELNWGAQITFNATGAGQLIFGIQSFLSTYISYVKQDIYQVYIPQGTFSCLDGELDGFTNQYVLFARNSSGAIQNVTFPGIVPGIVWTKMT